MNCRTKQLLDKIVNVYIACDLDAWTRNPTTNFKFKNCYLKNSDKEKYVYSGYGILFDSAGSWSFDNDSAGNVTIFGADNSSSSHSDNRKNIFLILGEGPTFGINGSFESREKKFSINFSKSNTKFCLSLRYNIDNSYLLVYGKKSLILKPTMKMLTFQHNFVSEVYLMDLLLLSLEQDL